MPKKAYRKYLATDTIKLSSKIFVDRLKVQFAVAYIDNDDIPDLMIKTNKKDIKYKWYTYKNGKVVSTSDAYYSTFSELKGYYKKKNTIYRVWATDPDYEECENLSGKNICFRNISDKNYQWGSKSVTKAQWNAKFKKRVGSTKLSTFKFYKNTATNRQTYLK